MVDESNNTWTSSFSVTVSATGAQITYNSYSVSSDNNGDGVINKGETIQLKISLKNTGTSVANTVKATFSTTSSYVSGFSPTAQINYGDISANGVKWADYNGKNGESASSAYYYTVKFTVSLSAPAGTQIPINISIVDESGNTWTSSFNVVVGSENAEIAYYTYTVVADYDGDKKVEKGETVYLQVYLRNIGSGTASSVKAVFSTASAYVSGFSPTTQIDYGNFSGGVYKYGQGGYDFSVYYTIKFTVSSSTPANTQIPIDINIADGLGNTWTDSFNVTVQ
jgi:hypothetical protein